MAVVHNYISVSKHIQDLHSEVVLDGVLFSVNRIPLFVTLWNNIQFTTTEWISDRKINTMIKTWFLYMYIHLLKKVWMKKLVWGLCVPYSNTKQSIRSKMVDLPWEQGTSMQSPTSKFFIWRFARTTPGSYFSLLEKTWQQEWTHFRSFVDTEQTGQGPAHVRQLIIKGCGKFLI